MVGPTPSTRPAWCQPKGKRQEASQVSTLFDFMPESVQKEVPWEVYGRFQPLFRAAFAACLSGEGWWRIEPVSGGAGYWGSVADLMDWSQYRQFHYISVGTNGGDEWTLVVRRADGLYVCFRCAISCTGKEVQGMVLYSFDKKSFLQKALPKDIARAVKRQMYISK
eukprot:GFYU01005979.1.p1 GENE.GFYU01005979.1~~GFYU01005979.1.p1  ORF type:complete len:166 (+),score=33.84 GFYU01005979.1:201-698(+)